MHESDAGQTPSFWDRLGIPGPQFKDERLAPQVDRPLLQQLVVGELPESTARHVYQLIDSFRSWNEAYLEVSLNNGPKPPPQ